MEETTTNWKDYHFSYLNAYNLLIGETTYDELAKQEVFYLPENHEDPNLILNYYESIEDYEKCQKIFEYIT